MTTTPNLSLPNARVTASTLATGPTLFWLITWLFVDPPAESGAPSALTPEVSGWIWAFVALGASAVALWLRGRALATVRTFGRRATDVDHATEQLQSVLTLLTISWTIADVQALLSGVFFLWFRSPWFVWGGAAVLATVMVLTYPRREWFEPFQRVIARSGQGSDR